MRIGICSSIENIGKIEKMGFDYIEWGVSKAQSLSREEFSEVKKLIEQSSIKPEACNVFFPGDIKIVGPDAKEIIISEYIKRALERVAAVGTKVVVVGSGGARRVPEGWDKEKGIAQFGNVLWRIGEEASQYGITVVIEPLNTGETNIINSVTEGLQLAKKVGHPNVKLLADFYHIRKESESMKGIIESGKMIRHLHIANSNGRVYPKSTDEDDYASFFNAIKEIDYDERISIEAQTDNFEIDAPAALKMIKELLGKA